MSELLDRLSASAARIADLRKEIRSEMDRRDSLICEAIEGRERYVKVARASRRSIGTVAAIVGRGDPLAAERQEAAAGAFVTAA